MAAARFTLDGQPVGDGTGWLHLPRLSPGSHRVAVDAPGRRPRSQVVDVGPGSRIDLEWALEPEPIPVPPARKQPRAPAPRPPSRQPLEPLDL